VRVLVVGGGGREHALCWKLSQSDAVDRLYAAPGNAGIAEVATLLPISASDVAGIVDFAERERVDLTVVGPEVPLVAGLADEMHARGMAVFGPTRDGARLEGSKVWARQLCDAHGIATPRSRQFEDVGPAMEFLDGMAPPYVVKADGLAAGKGVTIAEDRAGARRAVEDCLVRGVFGRAGRRVLVEEFLEGAEVSAMALTDGHSVIPLALAQDYKRALDGDRGPNTGGMGSYSPLGFVGEDNEAQIRNDILVAVGRALRNEGISYRGVLYAGLMLTAEGPKVLEFNCRFGDPETQVVLPRLIPDIPELLLACAEGNLSGHRVTWKPDACVGVVLASGGYPAEMQTGKVVSGLDAAAAVDGVQLFHSGTLARDGKVVTSGGRVLTVTAMGADVEEARGRAYEACSLIGFEGMAHRADIARQRQEAKRA
jgi:phosphoribosylamine---glycine ligase